MNVPSGKNMRSGAALLTVLIIVMVISVMSMSFLSRSNVQMACGENTILRMQMDYLADSGMAVAKTALLNPQQWDTETDGYWRGDSGFQLDDTGDDYFDITVTRAASGVTNRCTYDIQCQAYRDAGSGKLAESNLIGQLRLDPCIAYWTGAGATVPGSMTVNGDVYCNGSFAAVGTVNGDVFADSVTGAKAGQLYPKSDCSVTFVDAGVEHFSPEYNYEGTAYTPVVLASEDCNNPAPFIADAFNPAGVVYRSGNLRLIGDVTIDGTLVVDGNLTIEGPGSVVITSEKNYPGVVVNGTITVESSAAVTVNGLIRTNAMTVSSDAGDIDIVGALFVRDSSVNVDALYGGKITVVAGPMISSIQLGPSADKWSPAGGAFFKHIRRN